jgi:hypothetical protein
LIDQHFGGLFCLFQLAPGHRSAAIDHHREIQRRPLQFPVRDPFEVDLDDDLLLAASAVKDGPVNLGAQPHRFGHGIFRFQSPRASREGDCRH